MKVSEFICTCTKLNRPENITDVEWYTFSADLIWNKNCPLHTLEEVETDSNYSLIWIEINSNGSLPHSLFLFSIATSIKDHPDFITITRKEWETQGGE